MTATQLALALDHAESHQLNVLEAIVVKASHDLGRALYEIRRLKLYRAYGSWDDYLEQRFNTMLPRRTAYNHLEAYEESVTLKSADATHDTLLVSAVDQLSQNQLRASRKQSKVLTTEERRQALIDAVGDDGRVDCNRFYENLNPNPQSISVGAVVSVNDSLSCEWHGRHGTVESIKGNYCNIQIDGEDGPIAFSFKELELISQPSPPTFTVTVSARGPLCDSEWISVALDIFKDAMPFLPEHLQADAKELIDCRSAK